MAAPPSDTSQLFFKQLEPFSGKKFLVACSGGLDSMVLCHLMLSSGKSFDIAHMNYRLRGDESDGDEQFVRSFADKHGLRVHVLGVDAKLESEARGTGIQEYARQRRYEWFAGLSQQEGIDYILTAHHLDDQAETILHQFIRGGTLAALRGIKPISGKIIRPLLGFRREQLRAYALSEKVNWREDSSNQSNAYTRNYVRHEVIPALQKINTDISTSLAERAGLFAEMELLLTAVLDREIEENVVRTGSESALLVSWIATHTAPRNLLWHFLAPYGFKSSQVKEVLGLLESQTGKSVNSHTHMVLRDREYLILAPIGVQKPSSIILNSAPFAISDPIRLDGEAVAAVNVRFSADNREAYLDLSSLSWPLTVRPWQEGDRFFPLGMTGSQKVSDFLVQAKVALHQKNRVFVMESAGEIVWLIGHRISEKHKLNPDSREALRMVYRD